MEKSLDVSAAKCLIGVLAGKGRISLGAKMGVGSIGLSCGVYVVFWGGATVVKAESWSCFDDNVVECIFFFRPLKLVLRIIYGKLTDKKCLQKFSFLIAHLFFYKEKTLYW